jgi:hypothetical protein
MTVHLPWNLTFKARRGQFVYLSAQKESRDGSIEARTHLINPYESEETLEGVSGNALGLRLRRD